MNGLCPDQGGGPGPHDCAKLPGLALRQALFPLNYHLRPVVGRGLLEELYDEWWFITDAVELRIPRRDAAPGGRHRVELDLGLSIPYLIVGPGEGQPLLASSHTDKTIVST